ncbi:hypothetical protein [Dyella silvatica]|uniref:hypothetical protein n=1 Tax=Dyella silvatica TaxID=2992128 RepID=UPI00224F53C5|nr:hypothetical protein [Dyella silvatica]
MGQQIDMGRIDFKQADFGWVHSHHDLLIEISKVEMAMEHLEARSEQERAALRPKLESRISRLRDELKDLPAHA